MSDWTKARDEAKAQATSALITALLGWFRRKLSRRKAPPIVEPKTYRVPEGTEFGMGAEPRRHRAPRG